VTDMSETKYQLRLTKWDYLMIEDRIALDQTPLSTPTKCSAPECEVIIRNEGEFARHFIVPNPLYLNIGYCPNTSRGRDMKRYIEEAHRTR
jgi:hypothetical protein